MYQCYYSLFIRLSHLLEIESKMNLGCENNVAIAVQSVFRSEKKRVVLEEHAQNTAGALLPQGAGWDLGLTPIWQFLRFIRSISNLHQRYIVGCYESHLSKIRKIYTLRRYLAYWWAEGCFGYDLNMAMLSFHHQIYLKFASNAYSHICSSNDVLIVKYV